MATGDTKGDLINKAYTKSRISGLTSNPTPEDNELALDELEGMAAMFFANDICTGYNFEDTPSTASLHNLTRSHQRAYISNLAFWLHSAFGKQPPQTLILQQQSDYSFLSSDTAKVREVQYPSRQPRGSGSTLRWNRWRRYFKPVAEVPLTCESNTMTIGDVDDFVEHFDSYLNEGETIASYTIDSDDGLTISNDTLSSPDVSYRVTATGSGENQSNTLLQVEIVATTSDTRIETRIINFELIDTGFD